MRSCMPVHRVVHPCVQTAATPFSRPFQTMGLSLAEIHGSQKAAKAFVRDLIVNQIGITNSVRIKRPDLYPILVDVLRRHPEADRKLDGIIDLRIQFYMGDPSQVLVVKRDGTAAPISWTVCCTGRPPTPRQELAAAMRAAIYPQIAEFKMKNDCRLCALCGKEATPLHIDHVVRFVDLMEEFLGANANPPTTFGGNGQREFLPSDDEYKQKWVRFHLSRAQLRPTCGPCNLARH